MPSLRGGGAERTLINLLQKIDYSLYEVDLLVVSKTGIYMEQVPDDVHVTYLFKNNFLVRVLGWLQRRFDFDWVFQKKMGKIKKKYDVGISFLDSNFTSLLLYIKNIMKRIAFVHGSYLTHTSYERFFKKERYRKKLKEERYPYLNGIYFVSQDSMNEFIQLFGEFPNMGVIYNLIDRDAVVKKSCNNNGLIKSEQFTFSAVGSLIPIKGFDRLVRAAGIVRDNGYNFKIHLGGAGPEEQKLKRMIYEFELENYITLHGFLKNPYPLMKNSDVFVMSSVSEALPTVLCEAMILGVPTLVTDCSGCRGLVENGEYGMMALHDDRDLAEKMMLYMDKPELLDHYSKKSIERAELFDDEKILQAYYDIFDGKNPVLRQS